MIQPVVGSMEGMAMFSACAPRAAASRAPARSRFSAVAKSTGWKVTSKKHSRKSAWIASLIGCGTIWPPPVVGMMTLTAARRCGP